MHIYVVYHVILEKWECTQLRNLVFMYSMLGSS